MSNSLFGFDDEHVPVGTTDLSFADDKTLRLAMAPLSEEELGRLKRFEETYLAHGENSQGAEALARAHQEAVKVVGDMKPKRLEQGLALLRLFCGKRYTVHRLRAKVPVLEAAGPEKEEVRLKVLEELDRLEQETNTLARRFGQETIDLLRRHEAELLALHNRLTQMALSRT
jgi:hypothetical protein